MPPGPWGPKRRPSLHACPPQETKERAGRFGLGDLSALPCLHTPKLNQQASPVRPSSRPPGMHASTVFCLRAQTRLKQARTCAHVCLAAQAQTPTSHPRPRPAPHGPRHALCSRARTLQEALRNEPLRLLPVGGVPVHVVDGDAHERAPARTCVSSAACNPSLLLLVDVRFVRAIPTAVLTYAYEITWPAGWS